MQQVKVIETKYKGYRFRSRLEARWAVCFDSLGIVWDYESEGFDLGDAGKYLPDFWLLKFDCFFEVKGQYPDDADMEKMESLADQSGKGIIAAIGTIGRHEWLSWNIPDFEFGKDIKGNIHAFIKTAFLHGETITSEDDLPMLCPVCGDEFVHFGNPSLVESDDYKAWSGRGDAIKVPMYCENGGHRWVFVMGFHKGHTLLTFEDAIKVERNDFGLMLAEGKKYALNRAYAAALSARFEHGETPKV